MIFVRNKGQMCNNIYQYINMYAWAREHNLTTVSMRFAYKYQYFRICRSRYHNILFYLIGKLLSHIVPVIDYDNPSMDTSAKEQLILSSRHCIVEGWGVRYYDLTNKYLSEIRDLFSFNSDIADATRQTIRKHTPASCRCINVGIHIRRGDYRTFMGGRHYLDDNAYASHIRSLLQLLPPDAHAVVYICTNDPSLDRSVYTGIENASIVFPDGTGVEDLCLLSQCDYIIGPTSSFSLIATMYGKARLKWVSQNSCPITSLQEFGDFDTMSRVLDQNFFI